MSYTGTMPLSPPGMPRQVTLRRLLRLYEESNGTQPNIEQIKEKIGVDRRTARDYWCAMRRINLLAQAMGKTDPLARWAVTLMRHAIRYVPRDDRPTLRRVKEGREAVSFGMVNIAETPLLSEAHIAVKELTCPGPGKQRITRTKCPFDDLDEKEKGSCNKCQGKEYPWKLPKWKPRVSIWTQRQVFEESVLRCAREVEARREQKSPEPGSVKSAGHSLSHSEFQ